MKTKLSKCNLCDKNFADNELYCSFDDTSKVYTNDKFYCANCYKKLYPNWSSLHILEPQPYRDFLRENLDHFFSNWRNKK